MTNVQIKTNLSTQLEKGAWLDESNVLSLDLAEAKAAWRDFRAANGLKGAPKLLTYPENQHKLGLSSHYTVGLTLQSADGAGVETCPWRGQCAEVCVLKNGNGRFNHVQHARNIKTQFLAEYPVSFMRLLADEMDRLVEKIDTPQPVIRCRMNVNSDLRWYRIAPWFFARYKGRILFYDYTKNPAILSKDDGGLVLSNYLLVYSLNEDSNIERVRTFVALGGKVAAVTNRKRHAPVRQWAMDGDGGHLLVVDGDKTDDLWSHPEGSIIDLTAKGSARKLGEGFVHHVY